MASRFSLAQRVREPEDIDDPQLDVALLQGALGGLTTINLLSASARMVWGPIRKLARRFPGKPLTKIAVLYIGRTMSGFPGSRLSFLRNR